MSQNLILASSSTYRIAQLASVGVTVRAISPDIDETPLPDESPQLLAERLAFAKAQKIAEQFPQAIVIGSDQTACVEVDGEPVVLGKPGNFAKAKSQLTLCQGQTASFYSALCVYRNSPEQVCVSTELTQVRFRALSEQDIVSYLKSEHPYDCAGSFKAEGRGILLFDSLHSRDPNALIGMPLILLRELLAKFDVDLLKEATQASN